MKFYRVYVRLLNFAVRLFGALALLVALSVWDTRTHSRKIAGRASWPVIAADPEPEAPQIAALKPPAVEAFEQKITLRVLLPKRIELQCSHGDTRRFYRREKMIAVDATAGALLRQGWGSRDPNWACQSGSHQASCAQRTRCPAPRFDP
jgi:hypothetical protein